MAGAEVPGDRSLALAHGGQDLEAAVDLERVGGDRDGVFALGAKTLSELDRDSRFPHSRRAEDRYDGFRSGHDR